MPLTAAERAKRYRERKKNNQDSREEFLRKERERQRARYIPISEQSQRKGRKIRRQWRKNQRSSRSNKRAYTDFQMQLQTPPTSPEDVWNFLPNIVQQQERLAENRTRALKNRGRQRIRKLETMLSEEKRKSECYRKRFQRERQKNLMLNDSPRSKADHLLKDAAKHTKNVRKTLIFQNALIAQLRQKYSSTSQPAIKHTIAKIVSGNILRKYRMLERARNYLLGFRKATKMSEYWERKKRRDTLGEAEREAVLQFYERDDNSRILPGKKDTITRKKIKKQKRILTDTVKILYAKFSYENPTMKISYAMFCTLRPFWVTWPKLSDRNTCLCKRHDNMQLMANKLCLQGVFKTNSLTDHFRHLICDETSQECMYGTCSTCSIKELPRLTPELVNREVTFHQWVTRQQERTKYTAGRDEKIQVKVTLKESQTCTVSDLYDKYETELKPRLTAHVFNIRHQYSSLRLLLQSLGNDEIVFHVDFSENYSCKFSEEIQSVHFGASHSQVTLHTGVAYTHDQKMPFCSMSNSTRHDPSAIWAHLKPALTEFCKSNSFTVAHFITDGPTTQYRNKKNFYLASVIPQKFGFHYLTWNFLEAGHGKGAADGIGGAVKRQADRLVSEGKDIPNAEALFKALLPSTTIQLFFVKEEAIKDVDDVMPGDLCPLPGTMKLHQLQISRDEPGKIGYRILSCFCNGTKSSCACFGLRKAWIQNSPAAGTAESTTTMDKSSDNLLHPVTFADSLLNKWCVVSYDGLPYPGKIVDYDEDAVEVTSMNKIGENRFYWPLREDKIWYEYDKVLSLIPEPNPVGSRHVEIVKNYWNAIKIQLTI